MKSNLNEWKEDAIGVIGAGSIVLIVLLLAYFRPYGIENLPKYKEVKEIKMQSPVLNKYGALFTKNLK